MIQEFGGKVAIKDANRENVIYGEMSNRSNKALVDAGVTQDSVVAVIQEPASNWICSLLAILKVGEVYLPLNFGTFLTRLATMARDGQLSAILIHGLIKNQTAVLKAENMAIIAVSTPISSRAADIPVLAKPDSPAVILYTSGSICMPKGIILKHSSLVN